MTVRVRYAPSPTGSFHIGGARTALYNYLFAKANDGVFIVRIEDTDEGRSRPEYEKLQIDGLSWLGMECDEGPYNPGHYGPYRQSERLSIYQEFSEKLIQEGKAYYCFCSDEELARKREIAQAQNGDPIYDGTCRNLSQAEVQARFNAGESAAVRFKVPAKSYTFRDWVRGEVTFPEGMVGDFIIQRSSGLPVYNYSCVIDDFLMKITHVIRGDDHLANTLRQLMIYEAIGASLPEFAHVSLIVGSDRQKLSKRHGATSLNWYKDETYLPEAIVNYLALLGWSHPEEKTVFNLQEMIKVFTLDRFVKSPATFDNEKFKWLNGQHLKLATDERLRSLLETLLPANHRYFEQNEVWKNNCISLFRDKVDLVSEMRPMIDHLFDPSVEESDGMKEIFSWATTSDMRNYFRGELRRLEAENQMFPTMVNVEAWMQHCKNEMKVKGKPLFMGMRGLLSGQDHGPDLKLLIVQTPVKVLVERVG